MRLRLLTLLAVLAISAGVAYAHLPSCNISGHYCIYGTVYDNSGGGFNNMCDAGTCKGPIGLYYDWDTSFSSPIATVCNLHGHGTESSFTFFNPTNLGLATRAIPNAGQGRAQYSPTSRTYPANTVPEFNYQVGADADYILINGYPGGNPC